MPVSTHLTRYEGPSVIRERGSNMYLFDAGTDTIIAELSPEAAAAVRKSKHGPVRLTYQGRDEKIEVEP